MTEIAVTPQTVDVPEALRRAQAYFRRTQGAEGFWWGELESNPTMEAEYIMLVTFMGSDEGDRVGRVAEDIRRRQRADGTWALYHDGPGDLSTTVECYFALKLAGDAPDAPHMRRAREFVLAKGGVPNARVFTKIWLALFGQWDWRGTPTMPPEAMLLPKWAPFNLFNFACWARQTIAPLLVVLTLRPTMRLPPERGIDELFGMPREAVDYRLPLRGHRWFSAEGAFLALDQLLRLAERLPWKPLRNRALRKIERWVTEHQEADGSWGGIQPPWVYSLIMYKALGHGLEHPPIARGLRGFRERWSLPSDDGKALRVQACLSPVWDTALAALGLLDAGVPCDDPVLQRADRWLLANEVRHRGDWAVRARGDVEPSGWAFEFANRWYPDIDDTAIVVMVLHGLRFDDADEEAARQAAVDRAVRWLLAMQSSNGGWASFDKDNTAKHVAKLPFSDFGKVLDPPSVDVTAHVVEMFGRLGWSAGHPAIRRALAYIRRDQEVDGPWFGRWGVNYIYGTAAVLPALRAIGEDLSLPYARKAVEWLLARQNDDGGWGESCATYAEPQTRGTGASTASQTAWAIIALLAAGEQAHPATRRGIAWLASRQREDGTWDEPQFTGCGFPGYGVGERATGPAGARRSAARGSGFMINYHLYRNYFPLWALGRFHRATNGARSDGGAGVDG
ncbi:MAG: squalene--hopene cyclase [SAR202 cluster bacterium]|nr:squalene--hopene cyclase [SAR202 cluster bacterium]